MGVLAVLLLVEEKGMSMRTDALPSLPMPLPVPSMLVPVEGCMMLQ